MSDITVIRREQRIVVEPSSKTVSVLNIGRPGPAGPTGPTGPTGPAGSMTTGSVRAVNQFSGTATVTLSGGGTVTAKIFGGARVWPYATAKLMSDGTNWVVLGCDGRCDGFIDDFVNVNVDGGVLYSGQAWNWGTSGAPGGTALQGLYSGHDQFGVCALTTPNAVNAFVTVITQDAAIAVPWFVNGGLWFHSRIIVGNGRPNNTSLFRAGVMDSTVATFASLTSNSRGVCAAFASSLHATNWVLEIFNGTTSTSFSTSVAVTDQTAYEIDVLWMPKSVANSRAGFAGLWIDGVLAASTGSSSAIPEAFTASTNAVRAGASLATSTAAFKAIYLDSMGLFAVGPCTP